MKIFSRNQDFVMKSRFSQKIKIFSTHTLRFFSSSNLVTVSESCVPPRSTSLTDRAALWPTWRDQLPQLTSALTKGETKFPPRPAPQTNLPQCETNRETNAATTERLAFGVRPIPFLMVDKVLFFSATFPMGHLCKIGGLCLLSPKYRQHLCSLCPSTPT